MISDTTLIFRQLFDRTSCTYTYLLADAQSQEAVIIDPVKELFTRDCELIDQLQLKLLYILETHVHADHITSAGALREKYGAKIALGPQTNVKTADIQLKDNEIIHFGKHQLKAIHTPGHTLGCTCYLGGRYLFTGDVLFARGCGRVDFQGGSAENLFNNVRERLFTLPESTLVFPGHDYNGRTCSTIFEEKHFNPRLKMSNSLAEFQKIMGDLKLAYPDKMDEAVPANLQSGLVT